MDQRKSGNHSPHTSKLISDYKRVEYFSLSRNLNYFSLVLFIYYGPILATNVDNFNRLTSNSTCTTYRFGSIMECLVIDYWWLAF